MRFMHGWFMRLLPILLLAGACRPLLAPATRYPTLELRGHVSGAALVVAVQGDYAYLGFSYELVILNIADRSNPQWVTSLPLPTNDIVLAGDYAYVVGKGGFTVVDIADPTQPQPLGHLTSKEIAVGVVIAAGDAYFVEDRWLHQVDIADPTQPQIKRAIRLPSRAEHLAVADGYLYLSSLAGLHLFAIAAQAQPSEVCFIKTESDTSGMAVGNGYALVSSGKTLQVVDISTPMACHTVAQIEVAGWVSDLAVANDTVYVANGTSGLSTWDITDPRLPVAIGTYATGGLALTVTVQDGYLYLVDCNEGLRIYAIDDPPHLTAIGSFTPLGITANLVVVGAYAYMTAGMPLNLHQIDLTVPAQIHTVQSYRTTEAIYGLAEADEWLYLLTALDLQIIDISTPTKPLTVRVYPIADPTLQNLWYVVANRTHAYLGDNIGNVWVVNLAEPPRPIAAPHYTTLGHVGAMALVDGYAYLPSQGVGMRILDVAATGELTQVALYPTTDLINKIAVAHGYAYMAGPQGLSIVDVREPHTPSLVRHYATPWGIYDVEIVGNYALIAAGGAGLQVLDISHPAQPVVVATYVTPDCARQVVSANGLIYVADRLGGLYIFALTMAQ